MSHNDNIPERAARRHTPAILAIIAALALALVALLVFGGLGGGDDTGPVRELAPGSDAAATTPAPTTAPATTAPATTPASN